MNKILSLLLSALLLLAGSSGAWASSGAWLTYWDADRALEELQAMPDGFDELICFEAFFDESGDWFLPPESAVLLSSLQDSDAQVYLSLVNDVKMDSGSIVQKSKDFLRDNLLTEESREAHLDRVLELVDLFSLQGIEIDYENFKSDTELWEGFTLFLERLYSILSRDGVRLRVVMECRAPKYAVFPKGPEYICMCYNLYGTHSGPGPKADTAFLRELAESWRTVPGPVRMAFATGGFLWEGGSVSRSLTEQDASELLLGQGVTPQRDPDSMALKAELPGSSEKVVWYADGTTLSAWREVLSDMGYSRFDLFRLGGNKAESLSAFLGTAS